MNGALTDLLRENDERRLSHNAIARCYERTYNGGARMRRFSPLTYNLRRCFYASHKRVKWTGGTSTRALGTAFHQHVFHDASCGRGCVCVSQFGHAPRAAAGNPRLSKALTQRAAFMADYKLRPLASEVVVVSESTGVGTQVDELAVQTVRAGAQSRRALWLISWKTGYKAAGREPWRKRGKFLNTRLRPRPLATEENKHYCQLLAEKRMLNELGVCPDVCVIVYVLRSERGYVTRWRVDGFWAEDEAEETAWCDFQRFAGAKITRRCYEKKKQMWARRA